MNFNSSRAVIAQGVVAMLAGIQNPATGTALYGTTKLGAVFDPSPYPSFAEVTFSQAKSSPAGSGGNQIGWRIEDSIIFKLTSGWDYESDSTTAMVNMLTTMDIVVPILHSHYQIPAPGNPTQPIASVYSLLEDQSERALPVRFPNGRVYLLWDTYCTVKQQYSLAVVNP